jgi:hypothetical protein
MGTVTALNEPDPGFHERGEALANEITELCSYLYAAEYQPAREDPRIRRERLLGWARAHVLCPLAEFQMWHGDERGTRARPRGPGTGQPAEGLRCLQCRYAELLQGTRHDPRGDARKQFVDAHHIEHWSRGGETSLDNLVQLCREHHRLVHEGGFSCERSRSGELVFKDARERPLPDWSVLPRRNSENEAVNYLHERFDHLGIEADTCVPKWYAGDTCDWQMAVEGLLACEARETHEILDGWENGATPAMSRNLSPSPEFL